MSDSQVSGQATAGMSREEMASALFAQMVMQQANMAMMLLGTVPHPQSGETVKDLEAAKMFIDQLEMLEVKTRGNLSKPEEQFLKQNLMSLRMAFVEAVEEPAPQNQPAPAEPEPAPPAASVEEKTPASSIFTPDDESKKKFSKKY
jgi:hypothetical protein